MLCLSYIQSISNIFNPIQRNMESIFDATSTFSLQVQLYTRKPPDSLRQVYVGERTLLDQVTLYKLSRRNILSDNYRHTKMLNSWYMVLVETGGKNTWLLSTIWNPTRKDLCIQRVLSTVEQFEQPKGTFVPKSLHQSATAKGQLLWFYSLGSII